jgi:predicted PurR-regulated permease PerM
MALMMIVGSSLHEFSNNVPIYEEKLKGDLKSFISFLENYKIKVPKEDLMQFFATDSIVEYIAKTLKSLGSILTNSFMITLTVVFMLMELSHFQNKLKKAKFQNTDSFIKISDKIKHFIFLKSITSASTGIIIALFLSFLKIDYAILWGVLAFLLNFIPNIGSIIASIPAILMAIIQYDISIALIVAFLYLSVNIIIGSVIEPRVMGKELGLSTLIVFLSLIFWGWLLGPVGMLLSVPLTIMVKIVLDTKEDTKWISTLLGN